MSLAITLRPACAADEEFLYRVYAGTRAEELALVNWDAAQKETFLRMQFAAQHRYYHEQFPDAAYDVILREDQPVGRLYVHRRADEICIVDIALLSEHRRAGIGSLLLGQLLAEADAAGKPVRIHVEQNNPALNLYQRMGFAVAGHAGIYYLMERLTPVNAT